MIVDLNEKFIIRFVHQFSDRNIMTEVTKALESLEEYINFINEFKPGVHAIENA